MRDSTVMMWSCRKRNLRRLSHDTRQKGRKGVADARACRGHSDGSREIPMVRTPADPLGSGTPSRGRSQRRDTGRGPAIRCTRVSTHGSRAAARQIRGLHGFHTQGTCGSHRRTSRACECGHFGAGLVLWLQELEESEASVHAVLRRPVTYEEFSSLSDSLNACHGFYERSCGAGVASLR